MKGETFLHSCVGVGGTTLATLTTNERIAAFAGVSTGLWMLWQLGTAVVDRFRSRK